MTGRERVLNAIAHKDGPLPIDFGGLHSSIHEKGYQAVRKHLGLPDKEPVIQDWLQMIVLPDEELLARFGADCVPVYSHPRNGWKHEIREREDGYYLEDQWGLVLHKPKDGLFFDLHSSPLQKMSSLEEIKKYRFNDPEDPARVKGLKEKLQKLRRESDRAMVLFCPVGGIYEHSYFLRGLVELYYDMMDHPEIVDYLAARTCEWEVAYFSHVLKEIGEYVDVVQMGDDLGGQNGLLFSKEIYLKYYRDRERKVVEAIKKHSKGHVYMHNCGSVREVIPQIIENGVEILNPVQIQAAGMDSGGLKRDFGRDLTFWGGGCNPYVLTHGSPAEVEKEVRRRVEDFHPGGGFVFASVHNVQAYMPPANIVKMYETACEYR
jgi:uroporphyrinogen decarboxylase